MSQPNASYSYAKLTPEEQKILARLEQEIRRETGRDLVLVAHQKDHS